MTADELILEEMHKYRTDNPDRPLQNWIKGEVKEAIKENLPITALPIPEETVNRIVESVSDPVNHPSHYTNGNIEVIDFIEDQKLPYHLGNTVKYICRAGLKDPTKTVEDLKKAQWYLNRYIELLNKASGNTILERCNRVKG